METENFKDEFTGFISDAKEYVDDSLTVDDVDSMASLDRANGERDKYVALFLCICFGFLGAHKLYERNYIMFFIYLFTFGICGIGIIVDIIALLCKDRYYVPQRAYFKR